MKFYTLLLAALVAVASSLAKPPDRPSFTIKRSVDLIKLDGILDEASWKEAEMTDHLIQQFPYDTSRARARTEFRLTYDDRFLYVSAIAYDKVPGKYVMSSLRRDFRGPGLDGVSVILDPFQDVTNGFFFGVNPAGVQREGLIANGYIAREDMNLSWDNKWYSATKIHEGYWTAEFAIPYKTLRYKAGAKRWNVKLYRQDSKENERSVYPFTPRFFEIGNLNYSAEMIWDKPLGHPGSNVSLIPYTAGQASQDFEKGESRKSEVQVGGDAKIAVTSSLNLDLTVNPDFSQVEVDQQVTNLDRFEIFFPEKRQFFLENADLFSSFGHIAARPFFSRRIGVARDASTGLNVQNRILFGARLSGNVNKNWRIGMLNMQTAKVENSNIPSYNYTVATGQRRLGTNSNVRAIFVNRQQFKIDSSDVRLSGYDFNRVAGLDYNYSFLNNKWTGNLFYHRQFSDKNPGKEFAHGYSLVYSTQKLNFNWFHQIIGSGFDPAVGFVPRNGYKRISPSMRYFFYPKSDITISHGPTSDLAFIWDDRYGYTDHDLKVGYSFIFQSNSTLDFIARNSYTFLFRNFNATNTPNTPDSLKLPAFSEYTYSSAQIAFVSDPRKVINYEAGGTVGQYFNGTRAGVRTVVNYRFQPYGLFSVEFNYNRITLPKPYKSADIYLISPRLDLTLTKSVFFTTFFQYNSQFNNVNINSRFQWRFKPVSDLFIVYTDNYFYSTEQPNQQQNFTPKNRALVLKLTYWLNI
jgi:hypothetical protein